MEIQKSPKYSSIAFGGKPNLDEKILIFEDRVLGWQLDVAEEIRKQIENPTNDGTTIQHAGFSLMAILFTYFEMIAQYMMGMDSNGKSEKFFGEGVEAVFPGRFSKRKKRKIYGRIRCGLYHSGLAKKGALIDGNYPDPIAVDNGLVKVNPHSLSPILKAHFESYIKTLKSPASKKERSDFEKMYDKSNK
jgi:hypothetical protein